MPDRTLEALQRLSAIAVMKRDSELARLAGIARTRARLQAAVEALAESGALLADETRTPATGGAHESSAGQPINPAMIRARLRHRAWAEGQRSLLNQRLARVSADWLQRRPAAAQAVGRVAVLERLTREVAAQQARPRHDR